MRYRPLLTPSPICLWERAGRGCLEKEGHKIAAINPQVSSSELKSKHLSFVSKPVHDFPCKGLGRRRDGSSGTPLRLRERTRGARAARTSSEIIRPIVVRRRAASSLAASRTSSSMSSVVRIIRSSRINRQVSKRGRSALRLEKRRLALADLAIATGEESNHVQNRQAVPSYACGRQPAGG
jgi:hypothetical protein